MSNCGAKTYMYFLNMDFSLTMKQTGMKIAMHVAEIHWEVKAVSEC